MKNKYSLRSRLLIENEMEQLQLDFMEEEMYEDVEGMNRVEILDDLLKDPGGQTFKSDEEPISPDLPIGTGQDIQVELEDGTVAEYEHAPQAGEQLQLDFMYDDEDEDGLDRNIVEPDTSEGGF